jgi:hypothetical protein
MLIDDHADDFGNFLRGAFETSGDEMSVVTCHWSVLCLGGSVYHESIIDDYTESSAIENGSETRAVAPAPVDFSREIGYAEAKQKRNSIRKSRCVMTILSHVTLDALFLHGDEAPT